MTRRLSVLMLIVAVGACNGPTKPTNAVGTLTSLTVSGQTTFSAVGQSGQLTVFANYSSGTRQDVTAQVTFTVQNPSVVTVATGGAVKIVAYGSSPVTVTLQTITASVTISATPTVSSLTISQATVNLTAVGQTSQLTLMATFVDGSTKDVSGDAAWTSSATQVASIASGLVTATGLGFTGVTARYPAVASPSQSRFASVVVTPPGTFVLTGGTRDPGNGPLGGVTIVHQPSGQTTTSSGSFSLGGLTNGMVTFDRSGYEQVVVDTNTIDLDESGLNLKYVDVPMQPVTRINAGESVTRTIAPHDMDFPIGGNHCYPCQMIRVTMSSSGTLHLDVSWTESHSIVHLFVNGVDYPGEKVGPASVAADVTVSAGELLVYVGKAVNTRTDYVTFTLTTEIR